MPSTVLPFERLQMTHYDAYLAGRFALRLESALRRVTSESEAHPNGPPVGPATLWERIAALLAGGGPLTSVEIAGRLGISNHLVMNHLLHARRAGVVEATPIPRRFGNRGASLSYRLVEQPS